MAEQNSEPDTGPAYRKRVSYHGALLGGFATLSAAFLVMGDVSTRDAIAQRYAEDLQASLSQVVPARLHDNNLLDNIMTLQHQNNEVIIYQGIKQDQVTAMAYTVSGQGYAGEIILMMGINAEGEILGVRVLSHTETPGLGDKMDTAVDDWIYSFNGLSLDKLPQDKWKVKKDGGEFDQFSGATITPRAVVKAVKEGLDMFVLHKNEILAFKQLPDSKSNKVKQIQTKPDPAKPENTEKESSDSKLKTTNEKSDG